MLTPRVDDKQRRALWWSLFRPGLRDAISILLLVLFSLVVGGAAYWNLRHNRDDVRGAVPIEAEGVVTTIAYHPVDESNSHPNELAIIMVDGKSLLPNPETGGAFRHLRIPLRQGDRVRYTYRVGKSGRWYLNRLDPVPTIRE